MSSIFHGYYSRGASLCVNVHSTTNPPSIGECLFDNATMLHTKPQVSDQATLAFMAIRRARSIHRVDSESPQEAAAGFFALFAPFNTFFTSAAASFFALFTLFNTFFTSALPRMRKLNSFIMSPHLMLPPHVGHEH